jgi:hypothetical protein
LSSKIIAVIFQGFPCVNAPFEQGTAPRRFNVGDGLILIPAFALTMSVLRSGEWFERFPGRVIFWAEAFSGFVGTSPWSFYGMSRREAARMVVAQVVDELFIELLCSVLLGLTLVQPLMRLRSPRPPFPEVVRQSGFVVCLSVIVGSIIVIDLGSLAIINDSLVLVPAAVLFLLWPVLGLPPWRSEASWIDRLGRAVGWGWIVATASVTALGFL